MQDLTALILTWNERENIARTLGALAWVPKILIVDSFSSDETCEVARRFPGVEIVQRPFDSHTEQWNFGLSQVKTTWVLTLDADYEVSPPLAEEIQRLNFNNQIAYSASFMMRVFGRPIQRGIYPPRTVLFPRNSGRYVDDGHTQLLRCEAPISQLEHKIFHDDRKPLSRWIRSQDSYAILEARHLISMPDERLNRQDRLRKKMFFAAPVIFLYLLIGRGLIFDGWPGWYYVLQRTIAEMLLSLRLLTERHGLEKADASEVSR